MNALSAWAKGLATGGLLTGLWLQASHTAWAQNGAAVLPTAADFEKALVAQQGAAPAAQPGAASTNPSPAFPRESLPASGGSAEGTQQEKGPESPWVKVPDLSPTPRPGWFLLPPNGPGYYTALDMLQGKCLDKAPAYPYRVLFYENDFRYLDKPDGKPVDCLDNLKRIHLGALCGSCNDNWLLSIGGEERVQIKNEIDSRLTARDNDYQLLRSRIYGDLWYRDVFRVFVEFYDARSYNEDLPPQPIDVNKADLLNAFVDVKVGEVDGHPVYVRVGRQEMLYGSQRLVSPLDWANTRRTFEGAKIFYRSEKFDIDAFYTYPNNVSPSHYDAPNWNEKFAGVFATYRPTKGQSIDAYYFYLDYDLKEPIGLTNGGRYGRDENTFGARYSGDHKRDECSPGSVLWDFEGAYQFGDYTNRALQSGMATGGLGYAFNKLPMQPQFWAYYDWASGSPNLTGTGTFSTFDQLFPFGHYYFGYLDLVGRANIKDLNFQFSAYPAKWITFLTQYHIFRLAQAGDALYSPAPNFVIERRDPTGRAGTNVGQELDFLLNFQLDRHNSLLLGFSKLFSGDFIKQTGPNVNPELYYLQYTLRW
jgi:hypothetical protein